MKTGGEDWSRAAVDVLNVTQHAEPHRLSPCTANSSFLDGKAEVVHNSLHRGLDMAVALPLSLVAHTLLQGYNNS